VIVVKKHREKDNQTKYEICGIIPMHKLCVL
jgi:hypothetical protein